MHPNKKAGFFRLILIIIIAILVLSFFGIKLRDVAGSEAGKDNFTYAKEIVLKGWSYLEPYWDKYVAPTALYLWNDVFLKYVWSAVIENLDKLKN